MTDKKQLARHLYLALGKTQKEIALEVGVSERTIYTWVHHYAWHKLKVAALQAPATITDNLCSQLVEMQNMIAAREPGKRFPSQQEMDVMRKLVLSIDTMKKSPSLAHNMQMIESFKEFVRPLNKEFSIQLAHYANRFLTAKSKNGYAPYQMEYGIDLQAVSPLYDELNGTEPLDSENPPATTAPCESTLNCAHKSTGQCQWPKCSDLKLTTDDPKSSRPDNTPWQPLPPTITPFQNDEPEITAKPEVALQTTGNQKIIPLPAPAQPAVTGSNPAISSAHKTANTSSQQHSISTPQTQNTLSKNDIANISLTAFLNKLRSEVENPTD